MSVFFYLGNPVKGLLDPQKGHDTQVESHWKQGSGYLKFKVRWIYKAPGQPGCGSAPSSLFHVPDPCPALSRVICDIDLLVKVARSTSLG